MAGFMADLGEGKVPYLWPALGRKEKAGERAVDRKRLLQTPFQRPPVQSSQYAKIPSFGVLFSEPTALLTFHFYRQGCGGSDMVYKLSKISELWTLTSSQPATPPPTPNPHIFKPVLFWGMKPKGPEGRRKSEANATPCNVSGHPASCLTVPGDKFCVCRLSGGGTSQHSMFCRGPLW